MTHEELLGVINSYSKLAGSPIAWNALRAVVELHTPTKEGECKECRAVTDCSECYGIEFVEAPYPCPTILQIEKELK